MAILATRRRWLVTNLCAASRSPCSRQRLASMNSSCGSSMGNRLISSRYRVRPDSADGIDKAALWAITAPSNSCPRWPAGGAHRRFPEPAVTILLRPRILDRSATLQDKGGERKLQRSHLGVTLVCSVKPLIGLNDLRPGRCPAHRGYGVNVISRPAVP